MSKEIAQRKAIFSSVVVFLLLFLSIGNSLISPASARVEDTPQPEPSPAETLQPMVEPQRLNAPREPIPAQVIIQFAPNTTAKERAAYIESLGGTVVENIEALDTVVVTVPEQVAKEPLPESPMVAETEPDYYVSALDDFIPNDPRYEEQWALTAIGAPSAWAQMPADAPQVTVAVIDSGICASHPDLSGRILEGWDFLESDAAPQDDFGHGCSVAGVIASNMNDGIGIAGVAPNAQIMPLRVLNASGVGSYSDVAAAIVYAADNGAQVINLSLGGSNPSSTLENAVNYAVSKGVIVVAAAGNNGTDGALYPAAYPDVIAVGSVDPNLEHSNFSNYGSQIDIWAPGRDILTTKRDGSYGLVSGTSFAAPYVAGAEIIQSTLGKSLVINGQVLDLRAQLDITTPVATITPTVNPSQTPIVSSTPRVQIPGYYIEQSGKYAFSYPLDWELADDKYFVNENEIAIDSFVEIIAPDKEAITIRTFNNILPSHVNDLASIFLYPVLADSAVDYGTGSINGNEMIMVIEPGEKEVSPTVLYALFQCNSTVYRIQYIGSNGGTNVEGYRQLLESFQCDLSVQYEDTKLSDVNQKDFVPAPSMLIKPSETCQGYYDPTFNRFDCGQCTWWAIYSRPDIPGGDIWRFPRWDGSGDAYLWDNIARENEYTVQSDPEVGAIAVWEYSPPTNCTSGDRNCDKGHVAYVIKNNFNGTFVVTDMNIGCSEQDYPCAPRERTVTNNGNINFILGGITFFEDQNFSGRQSPLIRSNQSSLNYGWGISSVFIPAGWDAVFYRNSNYDSSSWRERFGAQTTYALNSSFWNLQLDNYSDGTNMNDNIRSVRVANNMCINPYNLSEETINQLGCGDEGTILDTTPPTGSWTSPNNNSTISSSNVTLTVNASDTGGSGVREVRWSAKWSGNWYGIGTDNSSPYSMSWNMCDSGVPNGDVEIGFEVWDNANNKWVYSENGNANIHITKNYNCSTDPGGTVDGLKLISITSPSTVQRNQTFQVSVVYEVVSGQLLESRGDHLFGSDPTYGAWPVQPVLGTINPGQRVTFTFNLTAPQDIGSYQSRWQLKIGGNLKGDLALINFAVEDGSSTPVTGGPWNTQIWMNKYLAGYVNWEGTYTWSNGYPYIYFDWGTGAPVSGWSGDEFSMRIWRSVYFPGGYYSFMSKHDDGIKVYLDGTLIIDAWWDGNGGHDAGRNVSAGYHEVKVEYYENQGDAKLELVWYGPGYPAPDINPPDGRITSPTNLSASNSSTLNISADAWDDASGVDHVEFTAWYCYQDVCDWRYLGSDSTSPYTYNWNWGYLPDLHVWLNLDIFDKTGKSRSSSAGWVEVDLDRGKPTASITSPTANSYWNTNSIPINVSASDSRSGVWKVQFFAGYNETTGAGAQGEIAPPLPYTPDELQDATSSEVTAQDYWHEIGWDEDGSNGWNFTWNAASVPDQGGASVFVYVYDKAGNYQGAQSWPVMLDRVKPSSAINFLPQYTGSTSFTVNWTGTDATSGIANYDIQYQDNGGSWTTWRSATTSTSATFTGVLNHTYTFQSRARDRAGNVEDWPASADTQTTVVTSPANDNFGSAINITSVPYTHTIDTRGATTASTDPTPTCGYGKNSNSVWYRYTAPATGLLEIDTWNSDFDTVLVVWKGTVGNLTLVDCIDDNYGYLQAWLEETPVSAGTTYYIEVMDYGNPGGGNLQLYVNFATTTSNNNFDTPTVINTLPYSVTQDTRGATQAFDDPTLTNCNRLPGKASVWYRYTPSTNANLLIDTKGSDYDTMLAVWNGARGNLVSVGCNDDIGYVNGVWDQDSILSVPVTAGTTYYIEASTYAGKIDINGASASELDEKPDIEPTSVNGLQGLQERKIEIDKNGGALRAAQSERPDEISAQFWGGTLKLNITVSYTISGNAGAAGTILQYKDGTEKIVTADGSGNYVILVPSGWSGTVTPFKNGYHFTPVNRTYSNLQSNHTGQNYTATACPTCADVNVNIGGNSMGNYTLASGEEKREYYNFSGGPVKVESTNDKNIVSAIRLQSFVGNTLYSFVETMGVPQVLLSHKYYFPTYNNTWAPLNSQIRFGNLDAAPTRIRVTIGGANVWEEDVPGLQERRLTFNLSGGPVVIESLDTTKKIVAAIRLQSFDLASNTLLSFSETMGIPDQVLSHEYYFPTYNNTWAPLNSQIRFGNLDGTPTRIRVTIGGANVWEEDVPGLEERRLNFNVSGGPVKVESLDPSKKIVAAIRLQSFADNILYSFVETMGVPGGLLSHKYVFPTYNNTWAPLNSQVRFGNLDGTPTRIRVTIGGVNVWEQDVPALQERRLTFNFSGGPVVIESLDPAKKIVAAIRLQSYPSSILYSFSETMGVPAEYLSDTYYFPTYNNIWGPLNSQLRFGVP